ncbi:MAG: hypothetical protein PUA61_08225 [Succinatimonas hippei]|nr:hypothetical protein [Succinatimonas hippei]
MKVNGYNPDPKLACNVIAELGGERKTAEIVGLRLASIYGWKTYGLPQSRYQYLKLKFPDLKAWQLAR